MTAPRRDPPCTEWEERLVDSVFAPSPDGPLERHLAGCAACRAARDRTLRAGDALLEALDDRHGVLLTESPSSERTTSDSGRSRSRTFTRSRVVAAAALLLVVFLSGMLLTTTGDGPGTEGRDRAPLVTSLSGPATQHFEAREHPVRVRTPIGEAVCERGRFTLRVREGTARTTATPSETTMSRRTTVLTIVSVAVLTGTVLWIGEAGSRTLEAGEEFTLSGESRERRSAPDQGGRADTLQTRSFDGRRAEERAPATGTRLQVTWDDGTPVVGRVLLVQEGEETRSATLDAEGATHCPRGSRLVRVVVLAEGALPRVGVPQGEDPLRVVVPRGRTLAGWARYADGRVARDLRIVVRQGRRPPSWDDLPDALLDRLRAEATAMDGGDSSLLPGGTARSHPLDPTLVTDAEGRFSLRGLPEDWSGALLPEAGAHPVAGGGLFDAAYPLARPRTDVELVLRRLPRVHGRVVRPSDGSVVPNARIQVRCRTADGRIGWTARADEHGRFALYLRGAPVDELQLAVAAPEGPTRVHEIPDATAHDRDLGDLAVPGERSIELMVRDENGLPLEGAVARTGDGGRISPPTDAEGRTTVALTEEATTLRVAALGKTTSEIPLPPLLPPRLDVTLEAGHLLLVELLREGRPVDPRGLRLVLVGSWPSERRPGFDGLMLLAAAGATRPSAQTRVDELQETHYPLDEEGRARIAGIPPDPPCRLEVRDGLANVVASRDLPRGDPATRTLRVEIPAPPRELRIHVRERGGNSLPLAVVHLHIGPSASMVRSVDDAGRLRIEGVRTPTVTLTASAPGFAPRHLRGHPLPPGDAFLEVTLEPAREARVRVVDAAGRPVTGASVRAHAHEEVLRDADTGRQWMAQTDEEGFVTARDWPESAVHLTASAGPSRTHGRLPAGAVETRLRFPVEMGTLLLQPSRSLTGRELKLRLRPLGNGSTLERRLRGREEDAGEERWPHLPAGRYRLELWNADETDRLAATPEFVEVRGGRISRAPLRLQ